MIKPERMADDMMCESKIAMTYQKIFNLKFKEDIPTCELRKRFPKEWKKISRIALLELPNSLLRELVNREREFRKLTLLKRWLFGKESCS